MLFSNWCWLGSQSLAVTETELSGVWQHGSQDTQEENRAVYYYSNVLDIFSLLLKIETDDRTVSPEFKIDYKWKHHNLGVYWSSLPAPDFFDIITLCIYVWSRLPLCFKFSLIYLIAAVRVSVSAHLFYIPKTCLLINFIKFTITSLDQYSGHVSWLMMECDHIII